MPRTFAALPLLPSLQGTLTELGLTRLTPVQARALPALLDGRSIVAVAETGSGKTLVYALAVLDALKRLEDAGNRVDVEGEPRAIVVVPSRDLGEQVTKVFKAFTHATRLRVRSVLGGRTSKRNREDVSGLFEVLVATPGRLTKLREAGAVSLDAVRFVVLDEADELLDDGFRDAVGAIVQATPSFRRVALLSATLPDGAREVVGRWFADAELIETAGHHQVVPTLRTRHVDVPDGRRARVLRDVLLEPARGGTMLFANTQAQCDRVGAWLLAEGHRAVVHRGNMDPKERRANLRAFRDGQVDLLVTTDVGARGLDIAHVGRVINVHLPRELDTYLHRVGRTARAGADGLVVNLVTPRDAPLLEALDDGAEAPAPKFRGPRRR